MILHLLEQHHKHQRLAVIAELDSDDAEQKRQMMQAVDDNHTSTLTDIHRNLNKEVGIDALKINYCFTAYVCLGVLFYW